MRDGGRHVLGLQRRRGSCRADGTCSRGSGSFSDESRPATRPVDLSGGTCKTGGSGSSCGRGVCAGCWFHGRQLPPGHIRLALWSSEWLLRRLHDDEQVVRCRDLLVTTLRGSNDAEPGKTATRTPSRNGDGRGPNLYGVPWSRRVVPSPVDRDGRRTRRRLGPERRSRKGNRIQPRTRDSCRRAARESRGSSGPSARSPARSVRIESARRDRRCSLSRARRSRRSTRSDCPAHRRSRCTPPG